MIEIIKEDHSEVKQYYRNYKSMTDPSEKKKWFNLMMWELARHSVAEELVLYPDIESIGAEGASRVQEARAEHHKVKEFLSKLQHQEVGPEFDREIDLMMQDLLHHLEKEENSDLVFYAQHRDADDRLIAGDKFQMQKALAPTRPHTSVPESWPTLEMALGLLLAPMDKARDMFTEFPKNP